MSHITSQSTLSRRTVLRGLGVGLTLPKLDAMTPAFAANEASAGPQRLIAIQTNQGILPKYFFPKGDGPQGAGEVSASELEPTSGPVLTSGNVRKVAGGFRFTEGPAWDGDGNSKTMKLGVFGTISGLSVAFCLRNARRLEASDTERLPRNSASVLTRIRTNSDYSAMRASSLLAYALGVLAIMLYPAKEAFAEKASLPNIVFMFADDLGYGDLGCYGHPYARTPAIDQLAKEGTRFTQFYVTGVTCNPSRTGLMTGLFPARFPKYAADFGFGDRPTITELLKKQGYRTGHFGKWHIGPDDSDGTYGIDTVETIGKSRNSMEGRDTDLYSAAIDFIRENKDGPFYVNVWGHATHFPVNTPESLAAKFDEVQVNRADFSPTMQHKFDECEKIGGDVDESMRQYLGDVYQIDLNVGRVLATLDELNLADNTIVVFSSDHGPAPVVTGSKGTRKYSNNMLGYAGEFRGGKHSQYEGGTRVPFIVRWPGHVKAGRVDSTNVGSFIDWLPTLCSVAGVTQTPPELDGEDISDIWLGADRKRTKPLFWKTSATGSTPAMRDGKWKLHLPRKQRGTPELYDLSVDPSESNNVADANPEQLKRLTRQLRTWNAELPTAYEKSGKRDKDK